MTNLIGGLERRYADVADVWVGGNLLFYFVEGDPKKSVDPDVLLVRGVDKWDRENYLLWKEKPPALIFEITSLSTRDEDTRIKKDLYEQLGVAEFVLFDPYGDYLNPRLQGYRLEPGFYQPISSLEDSLDLLTVGVTARPEGNRLRLVDTASGEKLLWDEEVYAAWRAAEELAEAATARRLAAERAAESIGRLREEDLL
jgi:hypothetical protein